MTTITVTPEEEQQLREIELDELEAYRSGKADAPKLYRPSGFVVEKGEKDGSGTYTFVANEESPDRLGDIIRVDGWDLKNFEANSVIMWAHIYGEAPVGTAPRIWKTKGDPPQLLNTVQFDMEDDFSRRIAGKVGRGIIKAESVGFRPLEWEKLDVEDANDWWGPFDFKKSELLEISIVPIPAHPRALAKIMKALEDMPFYSIPGNVGRGQTTDATRQSSTSVLYPDTTTTTSTDGAGWVFQYDYDPLRTAEDVGELQSRVRLLEKEVADLKEKQVTPSEPNDESAQTEDNDDWAQVLQALDEVTKQED